MTNNTTSTAALRATNLSANYGGADILHDLDVTIPAGKVTSIIGPNGCGKSTLLRTLAGLLDPRTGEVTVAGRPLGDYRRRELAQHIAMLPQMPSAPEGMLVGDLVALGRHPHQSWIRQWTADDAEQVMQALNLTNSGEFADRPLDSLSGGQRQRAWLSMALAQDAELLLLDEPTTYLDIAHAIDILNLVSGLPQETGSTVLMVLHDLNLAIRYSDHLVVMGQGRVAATGNPDDIITAELLRDVFRLDAIVIEDPETGDPMIVPKAPKAQRS
ncbi:ABC transporter ATP-binding protein [Corynebacterium sp. TAE3-ERU12]|uniref:ABC transporter ATP-binding protein n=1 Tax=Corynebacterium sp. TAE3-ERU12 TaxID=2849491 RepID=UPI001C44D3D4|nr:ABC transporter ATP-binding protein [Corynebacterium sp. TAE3-ERU12]MBV7294637.1 ABC transporter ATP-binding protein [Corynebacterium sp. TAE3-ERU12]